MKRFSFVTVLVAVLVTILLGATWVFASGPVNPPFLPVFGSGAPSGSVPKNQLYFDTGATYTGYVYNFNLTGTGWHAFSSGGGGGGGACPGGTTGQVQVNNAGACAGLTNTQLTADVNVFTTSLSGSVPAPGSVTGAVLGDDGTWHILGNPCTSVAGSLQYDNAGSFGCAPAVVHGGIIYQTQSTLLGFDGTGPGFEAILQIPDVNSFGRQLCLGSGIPCGAGTSELCIAASTCLNITTGDMDIALGYQAINGGNGASSLTGSGNVALGVQALFQIGGAACCNTAIGTQAGKLTNYQGGSHNVYLGYGVASVAPSGTTQTESRSIVLGTDTNCQYTAATNDELIVCESSGSTPAIHGSLAPGSVFFNVNGIYEADGTAGVSCTGSPTSSFATVNGIVTHC